MRKPLLLLTCVAAIAFVGCDRESAAERERVERSNALFAEAMTAETKGDAMGAEQLYRQLLLQNNTMASAHLNLAILLQDVRKDYLEAAHHYQAYLDLEPQSEKAAMVRDRLTSAKSLLATQLAAEIVAREQRTLAAERDSLKAQIVALERAGEAARAEVAARDKRVAELEAQVAQLRKLVDTLKSAEAEAQVSHAAELAAARKAAEEAKEKVAAEQGAAGNALLDAVRADAKRMIEEPDGGQAAANAATRAAAEGVQDEPPLAASPTPGKRYVVRPGDTLSRLSREAYGNAADWARIRDANRSTSNPDGRLRAGETILIP